MFSQLKWIKPVFISVILIGLIFVLPSHPIDPLNLLNLQKIVILVFTLFLIQLIGSILLIKYGHKTGSIITGFLGGMASSTATTASLAHRSKRTNNQHPIADTLTFLSATSAMLFEGLVVTLMGDSTFNWPIVIIFCVPLSYLFFAICKISQRTSDEKFDFTINNIEILPILKLAAFIVLILTLSKYIQSLIGQNALLLLTFFVSLFEIHGSMIANVQLLSSGIISNIFFGVLVVISILASFISKLFLVKTLGSHSLAQKITTHTLFLFFSLLTGWILFFLTVK